MPDYSDCYLVLGVTPDTDWKTLRANYRRLIGRWHPDRFSADPARKQIAEERSKEITLAYQALENYRRYHGVLPPTKPTATIVQGPAAEASSGRPGFAARADADKAGAAIREPAARKPIRRTGVAIGLAFSALIIAALYLVPRYQEEETPRDSLVKTPGPGIDNPSPKFPEMASSSRGFSTGSTLGEVYAIQGVPTLTEGDTWHYGKSQVQFARGKVVSWKEHPDDPLRLARGAPAQPRGSYFDVGSTKEEVRAIQGTPVRETDTMWDYAPSQVYFRGNEVIRWEESPVQPLRVPH